MRKLGHVLAFHRDEQRDGGLRNPAAPQSIGMAARPRGVEAGGRTWCWLLLPQVT